MPWELETELKSNTLSGEMSQTRQHSGCVMVTAHGLTQAHSDSNNRHRQIWELQHREDGM